MTRHDRKKGGKGRPLLMLFVFALLFLAGTSYGQAPPPPPAQGDAGAPGAETAGIEELVHILVEKGLLKPEEATAMMGKKGEPGFSALAALTGLLKAKGVLTPDEADRVAKKSEEAPAPPVVLFSERDRKDFEKMAVEATEEIKEEVLRETRQEIESAAAPEWTKRIRFGGDVRLRYEGDFFDKNNALFASPSNPTTLMNSQDDQTRFRVRARLGATVDIDDMTEAGIRMSTGDASNPVTSDQTMGTYMNKYSALLDLAYLKLKPLPGLTLIGGRIPNPWFFSDLVWWPSLTFEGFAGTYRHELTGLFEGFATAGAFPIQKNNFWEDDKWLYAGQVGLDIKPRKDLFAKIGVAFYDYEHTRGIANSPAYPNLNNGSAPEFQQKGNTLFDINPSTGATTLALAAQYRELNTTALFDVGFWNPIHVVFLADYVNNVGFDRLSVAERTGNPNQLAQTQGYQVGVSVGYPEMWALGQWRTYSYYRYLQADAVIDAFTDPDFHLGGTNAKGWILGADFGLTKNLWLSFKWTTANEISGPPLAIDSLFIDVNTRF